MVSIKVRVGEDEVRLQKINLVEFAGSLYKTKVGLMSLRKLGLGVSYELDSTKKWSKKSKYNLFEMTPLMRTLVKNRPNTRDKGIFRDERNFGRNFQVYVYLKDISKGNVPNKRKTFDYVGCQLVRDGELVDTIMAKATGLNSYRHQVQMAEVIT